MDKPTPKYKLTRASDGSVPEWPFFVLGARDPAAYAAMQAYIVRGTQLGYEKRYRDEVDAIAEEMEGYFAEHGASDVGQPRTPSLLDLAALCAKAEQELLWCTGIAVFAPDGLAEIGRRTESVLVLAALKQVRERFFPSLSVTAKPEP